MLNKLLIFLVLLYAVEGASVRFSCKSEGKFPDPNDETGSAYYDCTQVRKGVFKRVRYVCPNKSPFNAETSLCEDITADEEVITAETTTEITVITGKTEEITTEMPEFECTSRGRFADPADRTCRNYFLCSLLFNGTYVKTRYVCPMSNFNPEQHRCAVDYVCPYTTTTTTMIPTTEEDTTTVWITTTEEEKDTTKAEDTTTVEDTTTTTTMIPSTVEDTTTAATTVWITTTEEEKETTKTEDTTTAENTTTTTTMIPTTVEDTTTAATTVWITTTEEDKDTTTPEDTKTTTLSTTTVWGFNTTHESTTTTEEACSSGVDDFVCGNVGRFRNGGDCSCQWYYLCNQLRNGTFIQTPYKCPKNSIFDPSISICSLLYNCPMRGQSLFVS